MFKTRSNMDRDREENIKEKIIECHNRFIATHKEVIKGLLQEIGASRLESNTRPSASQNRIKQREPEERQVEEEEEEESEQEKGKQEKSERKENNNHGLQVSTTYNLRANRDCLGITLSKQLAKSEDFERSDIEDRSRKTKRKLQNNEADSEARKKKRVKKNQFESKNDDRFEQVETGRCFLPLSCDNDGNWHKTEEAKRGMYSILNRLETKEAPDGSSSYNFKGQVLFDAYKEKFVQLFVCYASDPYRRNCPVTLKLEYDESSQMYGLSRCGKHNHELDCKLSGKRYKSQFNKSMPPKIEILSSKLDSIFDRNCESEQPEIKQEKTD